MLTPHDELLCHQLPTTFDHVSQSDLRWTERIVMYGFDRSGEINVMTGLARYPNRNVTDAYAMITRRDGQARVVRMSTELNPQTGALGTYSVGPFTYSVQEPLRTVRAQLAPNEQGVALDLRLRGRFPAYEQTAAFHRSRGRVSEDARRFYQNGELEGWIEIDGERIEIDPRRWWFGRDHSWGIRNGPGGGSLSEGAHLQPQEVPDGTLYYMGIFEFEDELVHFAQRETSTGQRWQFEGEILHPLHTERPAAAIIDVEHDLKFRDDLRVISGGTFTVHRGDRTTSTIEVSPITDFWPGLAGYMEVGGYASGHWRGKEFLDGFTADTTDLDVVRPVSFLSETLCEVRMAGEGEAPKIGHGLVEMVFVGAYPRYGYTGW
ncbi:hypothetical protein C1S82_25755 [Mycolicibacterium cosmeticum]|uniref:Uncharacterized protein n=1 Tax=Mycolicibacterium cosmeticum TaxID=258533 RepID=W9BGB8_MYCCO|nr:hypothetical protein [Mycolicibacterium cosmeticum]TLH68864.1 hypothetical protein C1S82_25755 [Mycolicibacterium cosmeticum]CDO05525.1 hypothetical protein BN977_00299 [Mycolicibacterium cosmeticum]